MAREARSAGVCARPGCGRRVPMNKQNDAGLCPRCHEIGVVFRYLIDQSVLQQQDGRSELQERADEAGLVLPV